MNLRVLCLDIEGGYGGSSRSLYESIRHLPTGVITEVWCRRQGPIQKRYAALGVKCRVTPDMPHISSLPRLSRNIYTYGRFFLRWGASREFRRLLSEATGRFDVVHFNHEGLFLLARWLRHRLGGQRPGLTMHIRTCLPCTPFSRWQFRTIGHAVDELVFITENEKERAELLASTKLSGKIVYNIVAGPAAPLPKPADNATFKVAVLGNYAYLRGLDRLIEVASEIKRRGNCGIKFVVAGNMTLPKSVPGLLGEVAQRGGDLSDYAAARGVGDMFQFLGHMTEPETVLAACDMIARPSRQNDPWGRDVLEAMAYSLPTLSTGAYDRFVETDVTGILRPEFDASAWADDVIALSKDPGKVERLGESARQRVSQLCDGAARAADLVQLWAKARRPCAA